MAKRSLSSKPQSTAKLATLANGRSGIAVFTRSPLPGKPHGSMNVTRHWKISLRRQAILKGNCCVVYIRNANGGGDLYEGVIVRFTPSTILGRSIIHVGSWKPVGMTHSNWHVFAGGSSPVRYF